MKRKSPDTPTEDPLSKRQAQNPQHVNMIIFHFYKCFLFFHCVDTEIRKWHGKKTLPALMIFPDFFFEF